MIYCQISTLRFFIEAEAPLAFPTDVHGLRGFSCPAFDAEDADYHVTIHSKSREEQYNIVNRFDVESDVERLEPNNLVRFTHKFSIATTDVGVEIITVEYKDHPTLKSAELTICNRRIDIFLSLIDKKTTVIDPYIFPLLNLALSRLLLRNEGLLVHSSVVNDHGSGYLFTAVSGTGKSTMARIFQSKGATIINDDMNALKLLNKSMGATIINDDINQNAHDASEHALKLLNDNELLASNIPMSRYIDSQRTTRLKAIFLIEQSKENFIEPLPATVGALRFLANTINYPLDKESASLHFQTVKTIANIVPIYRLGFKPDTDIVLAIRKLWR